jgi:ATP-dependent Lon protease
MNKISYRLKNKLSKEIIFLKNCLIDISSNLIQLNKLKIFENTVNGFSNLFNEIEIIKKKIEILPDILSIEYLKNNSIDLIINEISNIKNLIERCINHISPKNINYIMKLLNINYTSFNSNEYYYLELLSKLFIPINVWDSQLHKNYIEYINNISDNNIQYNSINKNVLDSISQSNDLQTIIIEDTSKFPNFLKNITNFITKDKKILKQERNILFNYSDIIKLFDNSTHNIIFCKNTSTISLVEDKQGFMVVIRLLNYNNNIDEPYRLVVLQGILQDDILELYKTNYLINKKITTIKNYIDVNLNIPDIFKMNFINILNIRDILVFSKEELCTMIKKNYNSYKLLQSKTLGNLINDFLLASKFRKIEILILLLSGLPQDNKIGFILYDILKLKDKTEISVEIYNSLPSCLKLKFDLIQTIINKEEEQILHGSLDDLSYERRINMLDVNINIKNKAIDKLKQFKNNYQGDNKAQTWIDGFLKIPFGIYKDNEIINFKKKFLDNEDIKLNSTNIVSNQDIQYFLSNNNNLELKNTWNEYKINRSIYLNNIKLVLDKTVYGHYEAKMQLTRLFAKWINGTNKGAVIGLMGPPGTGKTLLIKNGLSQCLIDIDGKNRPFGFIPIGGSVNGSTLVGHNYTYAGSTWGRIVDILMQSGCMNPIIFIDEIDKISSSEYGKEIISILTHLTDSTQNDSFEDKYFSGIPLDLSKVLFVFSFNDINLIDPILKDRITIIETKAYTLKEKIHIIQNYMLPEILKDVGFNCNELIFTDEILIYIINTFTNEAGVRKIKEKIVEIVQDINLKIIMEHNSNYNIITKEYVDILFKNKLKIKQNKIHSNPEVGLVNGLYATNTGTGGLTVIQVIKYPSDKMLELKMTGQQGEVMKESVEYAMKIAYNLLNEEEKNKILEDSKNKINFGLLIHTPEAGTKKEGPSAGAAMTLAIYSVLTNKKVDNTIALTGEIDLWKNIKMIGGVYAKLIGAKNAGIKLVLLPNENLEDLEILRNENMSPEDDTFKVNFVDTIEDIIEIML